MSIQLVWDDEARTILRHIYSGYWTVAEFRQSIDESRRLLLEVTHPVDLLVDMTNAGDPPIGLMPAFVYAEQQLPPNQRLVVIVQAGSIMAAINQANQMIAPRIAAHRHILDSIDDAYALIADYRKKVAS